MAANLENPILLVNSRKQDHQQRVIGSFGEPKEIVDVTPEFRKKLTSRIDLIADKLQSNFQKYPNIPAVITLRLHTDAMAKTHRPMMLLDRVDMLPIGTRRMGELLLPATANSLLQLSKVIRENEAKVIRANISTIDELALYGPDDVLRLSIDGVSVEKARSSLSKWINDRKPLILERFTSSNRETDAAIHAELDERLRELKVEVDDMTLRSSGGATRIVFLRSLETALQLAGFPAIRSLHPVDEFSPIEVRPQMFAMIGQAPSGILPPPAIDLPIVGVIDSGIRKNDKALKAWVTHHSTYVLAPETDNLHGTFVAGLIAGSRRLNGNDPLFPSVQARVFDLAALASSKPGTTFDEMFERINETVRQHPEVKIWNCSFGSNSPCHAYEFGQLSHELDALADDRGVLFVIAAGNYETTPLRAWPPTSDLGGQDRISQPAESVRALTVGSVAHVTALVNPGEPSPFSRRGPGPSKTPKPDLTHRGGNCNSHGQFSGSGVRSLLPGGDIGESVGTSFSTPIISAIAANVWQALEKTGTAPRPDIVKALLIHAAALSAPIKRSADDRNYYGFGVPESVMDTLFCTQDSFTVMFDIELFDGIFWEKTPFPIPACLHPGGTHLRAEVIMTLAYSPPLDARHGAEYIRANIDASFGTYDPDDDGELHQHGLVPLDVPRKEDLYEKAMIDHGFKWSPVKVYRGIFRRGKAGKNFRLRLEMLRRAGEPAHSEPQRAIVLLTFRGITPGQPVYADGLRAMRAANWVTQTISTRTHVRV
jgi:serine protease AprX